MNNKDATIDHIIPTSKGGASSWVNMVASCRECNLFKGRKMGSQFKEVIDKIKSSGQVPKRFHEKLDNSLNSNAVRRLR